MNGSVGKWWFVVRGEKFDIDALVETPFRLPGNWMYIALRTKS